MSLLQLVNSVQNSMDSELVSTISETEESEQVLQIIRDVYEALITKEDWPHLKTVSQLTGLGDINRPNFMRIPDTVSEVYEVRYRTRETGTTDEKWSTLIWLEPEDFLDRVHSRSTSNSEVSTFLTSEGIPIYTNTDKRPEFYTSFDDDILIFDSYISTEDTTLQQSKSIAKILRAPTWSDTDTFIPDLPGKMFPTLLARCKQVANEDLAEKFKRHAIEDSREGKSRMRRVARRAEPSIKRINYGRR